MPPKSEPKPNPWEPVLLLLGFIIVCLALIWARGGLQAITNEGFFIQSPAAPQPQPQAPSTQPSTSDNSVT